MSPRRLTTIALAPILGIALALVAATPAAAVTLKQKLSVMWDWSQPTTTSYNAWNSGRLNQAAWVEYGFDWSTDYCTSSPDQPLGFDFRLPCYRHDFGYGNYKLYGDFPANRSRIDDVLYFDLSATCATYNIFVRPACYSLAWTYYQAVKTFGGVFASAADLDRAKTLKEKGLRAQAAAARRS
jgi:hypothetical protein